MQSGVYLGLDQLHGLVPPCLGLQQRDALNAVMRSKPRTNALVALAPLRAQ